jgi:hypothetical protein
MGLAGTSPEDTHIVFEFLMLIDRETSFSSTMHNVTLWHVIVEVGEYRYQWFVGLDVILETQIKVLKALAATA